jgi:Pectinacetylesterase
MSIVGASACAADSSAELDEPLIEAARWTPAPGARQPLDSPVAPRACNVAPVTISHNAEQPVPAFHHLVDLAAHPLAVCNDGTPAHYILRPGTGEGRRRWVIFLEGGGGCTDAAGCALRYRQQRGLMSSAGVRDGERVTVGLGGIKSASSTINPDFYDANFVELKYCSSDWHTGDRAGDPTRSIDDLRRWSFRGRAIVRAVMEELWARGLSDANEVLLTGGSAGGVGVANVTDDVRAALPATIRMVALPDAAYVIAYPAYDPVTKRESLERPTPTESLLAQATAAWGGRGDTSCHASAPQEEQMACRAQSYLYPHDLISVPTMIRQSQLDPSQLDRLINPRDTSAPANAFRERFAAQLRAELATAAPRHSIFSSYDTAHTALGNDELWPNLRVDGTSLRSAVGAWYRDPCTAPVRIID